MEHVDDILGAASSPWGLVALLLLGFFALTWKYGHEILATMREVRSAARDTHDVAKKVEQSIVTNHGSKNIGDAIDRLTGWYMDHQEEAAERQRVLNLVVEKLDNHIDDCRPLSELVQEIQKERGRAAQH
jgi:hypothetical protein